MLAKPSRDGAAPTQIQVAGLRDLSYAAARPIDRDTRLPNPCVTDDDLRDFARDVVI